MDWFIGPLKNYAVFSGRTRRSEFWAFILLVTIIQMGARFFDGLAPDKPPVALNMGIAELCIFIIFLVPSVAVGVRRLHDSGRSGLWMLLGYGPLLISNLPFMAEEELGNILVGAVLLGGGVLLIMMLFSGTNGQNQYGADPRRRGI
jgi:uncharacterized membrane protein YhaH (DUF805 family)